LVRRLRRHARRPERFTDRQRAALVGLVGMALAEPDDDLAIAAAGLLVAMEGENLRRDRAERAAADGGGEGACELLGPAGPRPLGQRCARSHGFCPRGRHAD
jgi:hypothetical protein